MAKYIVNIILVTACLFTYTSCIRKMNLYDENRNTGQDNNEKIQILLPSICILSTKKQQTLQQKSLSTQKRNTDQRY